MANSLKCRKCGATNLSMKPECQNCGYRESAFLKLLKILFIFLVFIALVAGVIYFAEINRNKNNVAAPQPSLKPQSQLEFDMGLLAIYKAKWDARAATREADTAVANADRFWASAKGMNVVRWKCKYDEPIVWQPQEHLHTHDRFTKNAVYSINCMDVDAPLGKNFSDGSFSLNIPVRVLSKPAPVYTGDVITFTGRIGAILASGSYVPPNHVPYKILITDITDISFDAR